MYQSCVTYHTGPSPGTTVTTRAVLKLIADRPFDPQPFTSEVVAWENAPTAYVELTTKTFIV